MLWFILLSTSIVTTLLFHSVLCYYLMIGTALAKFVLVGTVIGCILMLANYKIYGFDIELLSATFVYAFICELYIFMFSFISSSISASILLRLKNGPMPADHLTKEYSGEIMVDHRIKKLQKIQLMQQSNDDLLITKKGEKLINKFNSLRIFFGLPAF